MKTRPEIAAAAIDVIMNFFILTLLINELKINLVMYNTKGVPCFYSVITGCLRSCFRQFFQSPTKLSKKMFLNCGLAKIEVKKKII